MQFVSDKHKINAYYFIIVQENVNKISFHIGEGQQRNFLKINNLENLHKKMCDFLILNQLSLKKTYLCIQYILSAFSCFPQVNRPRTLCTVTSTGPAGSAEPQYCNIHWYKKY